MACRGWIAGAFCIATLGSTGPGRADVLTFQHGDGGGYSGTLGTTIGPEAAANFGVHFLLTIRTYYYQSLVCFPDIIGENPGQIPPGSTITLATLSVTMYDVRENSSDAEQDDRITRYYSDDAQDHAVRPKLTVEFTPPLVAGEQSTWGRVKALYR